MFCNRLRVYMVINSNVTHYDDGCRILKRQINSQTKRTVTQACAIKIPSRMLFLEDLFNNSPRL